MEYNFTESDYREMTHRIMSELVSSDYFSGKVEIEGSDGAEIAFSASLILYRNRRHASPDRCEDCAIVGVGVVWYDVEVRCNGEVVFNDFDMEALSECIVG